jgi:hypothetical protein
MNQEVRNAITRLISEIQTKAQFQNYETKLTDIETLEEIVDSHIKSFHDVLKSLLNVLTKNTFEYQQNILFDILEHVMTEERLVVLNGWELIKMPLRFDTKNDKGEMSIVLFNNDLESSDKSNEYTPTFGMRVANEYIKRIKRILRTLIIDLGLQDNNPAPEDLKSTGLGAKILLLHELGALKLIAAELNKQVDSRHMARLIGHLLSGSEDGTRPYLSNFNPCKPEREPKYQLKTEKNYLLVLNDLKDIKAPKELIEKVEKKLETIYNCI